jgi:aminopeptidase-like protein
MNPIPRAEEIEVLFDRLWPICRSITGNGVRESLQILGAIIPIRQFEIASGTKVLDWEIPKEWNIREAWIKTPDGRIIANFEENNLHIVSYSIPIHRKMNWTELKSHLHSLPQQPKAIPYITSYYKETWGFCLSHETLESMPAEGEYEVLIDSSLEDGHLTYGEIVLPGITEEEILISTYICHPSMANNELSGPITAIYLAKYLSQLSNRRYTYRILFIPETIGAIAYLNQYGEHLKSRLKAGYVITCCGDDGQFRYKKSRRGDTLADRAALHYLRCNELKFDCRDFTPDGSDERQFCSPGFNLPVGSLMRTSYYLYPQYHTSLDNKNFISFPALVGTIEAYISIVNILEMNRSYVNLFPFGEPRLGKRGLYPHSLSPDQSRRELDHMLHILNYSDGEHDLLQIAEKRGCNVLEFSDIVDKLVEAKVIETRG